MNPPRHRRLAAQIADRQRQSGVPYDSVLRDHALSYMLAGIATQDSLRARIVFKGGTALRKCYFADYRYSEDLDFSTRDCYRWTTRELSDLLADACLIAQHEAEQIDAPYSFVARPEQHRRDHSDTQHNFRITVTFPTGATLPIKVELTQNEPLVLPVESRVILHAFPDEPLSLTIPVYSLDEVVLEKLRAFLQTAANLERRAWANRARDLYDLWWLWTHDAPVSWNTLRAPLAIKSAARAVAFSGPRDFLDLRVLRAYRESWQSRLGNIVPDLPPFEASLDALQSLLGVVFQCEKVLVTLD